MADYLVTDSELTSVADAIRTKGGTSAALSFPTGFVSAIDEIPTGSGGTYTWFGANPVLLAENEVTLTLDDTSYPSWTPSTSQGTILQDGSFEALPYIEQPDFDKYDMAIIVQFKTDVKYASGTEMKAAGRAFFYNWALLRGKYFQAAANFDTGLPTYLAYQYASTNRLFYYNTSGAPAATTSSYGPAYTNATPGFSVSNNNIKTSSPPIYARCSTSYFSTAAAAAVDTANSTITFKAKAYQVDKPNIFFQLQKMISDDWRALT